MSHRRSGRHGAEAGAPCGTLNEAVEGLREDPVRIEALGEHVFTQYTQGKIREWEQYRSRVSNWELERYMIRY